MIKIIALITMLIDHIGIILFPQYKILNCIGRVAFPLFCYSISVGVKNTKNIENYFFRLAFLALISQPVYTYAIGSEARLNIVFSFAFFVFVFALKKYIKLKIYTEFSLIIVFSIIAEFTIDYGAYGIIMIAIFYYLEDKVFFRNWLFIIWTVIFVIKNRLLIQLIAILDVSFFNLKGQLKINKYFFYIFYPTHLLIIKIIKILA